MKCFVNLPLSWVYQDAAWLERLFRHAAADSLGCGLGPELGLDENSLVLPLSWHKEVAARNFEQGLFCAVHLPFFMLPPGNVQNRAQGRKSLDILCNSAEIANIYEARHLIGHPGYIHATDAVRPYTRDGTETSPPSEAWLEYSIAAWEKVAGIAAGRLFLENTYENGPEPLAALLGRLTGRPKGQKIALCFDIGHWHCFARGSVLHNLETWVNALGPYLGHLHLHDNNGGQDQHLGLGSGTIPFADFFALLRGLNLSPAFTLEPHEMQAFDLSLAWMEQSPELRLWLKHAAVQLCNPPNPSG
jgi:sugar phosphate isomerase/epimerase